MSYWTGRDFQDPIRKGNERIPGGVLFYTVHECRGYHLKEPANLGGLLGVVNAYDFSFNEEQKGVFITQLKEIGLTSAADVLGILDIAEYNKMLDEVQKILIEKLEADPVEKASEWYMSVREINRTLCHLRLHAQGGAVNGSWWLTPKEDEYGDGESLIGGYYNFRDNHLRGDEAKSFIEYISQWSGPNGEKEELFPKVF